MRYIQRPKTAGFLLVLKLIICFIVMFLFTVALLTIYPLSLGIINIKEMGDDFLDWWWNW